MTLAEAGPPPDVVAWGVIEEACSRCGQFAKYYVTPYWRPEDHVCPRCCIELNRLYDARGWPPVT